MRQIVNADARQRQYLHVPTSDGRELVMTRYTQPQVEHRMLLDLLHLKLPEQPPPKITGKLVNEGRARGAV